MNNRIRELAELATCDIKDEFGNWVGREFDKEKFAELLIKQCRDIVGKTRDQAIEDSWNVDEAMSTAMYDIEKYFGV